MKERHLEQQFPPTREANSEAPKAHSSSSGGIGSGVESRIRDETWVGRGEVASRVWSGTKQDITRWINLRTYRKSLFTLAVDR